MRKIFRAAILIMLIAALTAPALAAGMTVSGWASGEISAAEKLSILPGDVFAGDLTRPITRAEFAQMSVFFTAAQYNVDVNDFVVSYFTDRDIATDHDAFADVDDGFVTWAQALGVVDGYGDGTFRPDAEITRQEAAKMLLNTYRIYGGDAPDGAPHSFSDSIADWAADAVSVMSGWAVMRGVGGTLFDPIGSYTVEQSIVTFLRLYENAPVSRAAANVTHYRPYDDALEGILTTDFFRVYERFDLELCTVIYGEQTGIPHGSRAFLWIVYKNGGWREILRQLPQDPEGWQNDLDIRDLALAEDESAVTFTRNYEDELHYYSVNLETGTLAAPE